MCVPPVECLRSPPPPCLVRHWPFPLPPFPFLPPPRPLLGFPQPGVRLGSFNSMVHPLFFTTLVDRENIWKASPLPPERKAGNMRSFKWRVCDKGEATPSRASSKDSLPRTRRRDTGSYSISACLVQAHGEIGVTTRTALWPKSAMAIRLPDLPGAKAMAFGKFSPAWDARPPSPSYTFPDEKSNSMSGGRAP